MHETSVTEILASMSVVIVGVCLSAFFGSRLLWDYLQRKMVRTAKGLTGHYIGDKGISRNEGFAKEG